MQLLPFLLLAVVFTAVGLQMTRLAQQALQAGETATPPAAKWFTRRGALTGLALSELALCLFLPCFYGTAPLTGAGVLLACAVLWPCAWTDARRYLIPNRVLLAGAAAAAALLALRTLQAPGQAVSMLVSTGIATAAILFCALLCRLVSPKAVGMGDIKLLAVLALCLGMELVWAAVFYTFVLTFFVGVFLLATKRARRSDSIPFAPFLLFGTIAAAFLAGI